MAKTKQVKKQLITAREIASYLELKEQAKELEKSIETLKARILDTFDASVGSHDIGGRITIGRHHVEIVPHARVVKWKDIVIDRLGQEAADAALEVAPFSSKIQISSF